MPQKVDKQVLSAGFELKKLEDSGSFSGYGSVFGVSDYYNEVVERGAFRKTLRKWKQRGKFPKLLWQHDSRQIIGKYTMMREDSTGLYVEGKLFLDTIPQAQQAYALLQEGELDGLSIGFLVIKDEYDKTTKVRRLLEVDLWEVSLVTFPANGDSRIVGVKGFDGSTIRDYEEYLCDLGHSKREATLIASKCFDIVMNERESRGGVNQPGDNAGEPQDGKALMEALIGRDFV